ncbi:lipoate--protein ligase family protein [Candidatus Acetothermia bacterium]|nr:lipoate--protein ligase family protein [Candidatus Acetothermia bacterium]
MLRILSDLKPHCPLWNLSVEEAIFTGLSAQLSPETLRIWCNDRAVVIGRSQSAQREVSLERAMMLKIPIVRRISGGGAVYHYPGNLNYSLFLKRRMSLMAVSDGFLFLGQAIIAAMKRLDIELQLKENSLFVAGKKIAGLAQARRKGALLIHGTLLIRPDKIDMKHLLLAMGNNYLPSRVPSHPALVTSLMTEITPLPPVDSIAELLCEEICQQIGVAAQHAPLSDGELARAEQLLRTKYGSATWNL